MYFRGDLPNAATNNGSFKRCVRRRHISVPLVLYGKKRDGFGRRTEATILLLSVVALSNADTLQNVIDVSRLQAILQEGVTSKDTSTLYHALKGLKQLNAKIPDVCGTIKSLNYDANNLEAVFYVTNAAALSGCQNSLTPNIMKVAVSTMDKEDITIPEMYYSVYTLKALGKGDVLDKDAGLKNLIKTLKKDDSHANYGYVFALCEHMGCESWSLEHAESVLLSADETDGKSLHFEGGLPTTALLLGTIQRSAKSAKKPSPISEQQRYKFAEYIVSRRAVSTARGAALILEAASAIADDEPTPIAITIKGKRFVTLDSETIEVSVTDILGRPIKSLRADDVIAQSGTRLADDVVVLSKQVLTQKSGDPSTFVLNLSKIKSQYGQYKISLSAAGKTANVVISVLGEIVVTSAEVGIGDVDGTTSPKLTTVAYPNKLTDRLQADHLQKLTVKWTVRDKSNKAVTVQQAFLRISTLNDEAIFVAEPDNTKAYKVELSVAALGKLLNQVSGEHTLTIYLGDSAVSNPIQWTLGSVSFNYGKDSNAVGAPVKTTTKAYRGPLPEIQHEFRQPEPRPPRAVSDVFALACAAPLLLLLGLWAKLRVNLSNMPLALSALVFHISLGASLALYGCFWLQLSMFETMRYLLPLAALTFLSGHRLLRRLVHDKATVAATR